MDTTRHVTDPRRCLYAKMMMENFDEYATEVGLGELVIFETEVLVGIIGGKWKLSLGKRINKFMTGSRMLYMCVMSK